MGGVEGRAPNGGRRREGTEERALKVAQCRTGSIRDLCCYYKLSINENGSDCHIYIMVMEVVINNQ